MIFPDVVARVPVLLDGTMQAMTSTHLGNKIKNLKTSHDMWDAVKVDTMTKSTLLLLNMEDQLASMKLTENDNPKAHLMEVKQHFQLMGQQHNNLLKMGLTISDFHYNTIIMSSLPESYQPTDNNSCGACEHPAWHIVIKGDEA